MSHETNYFFSATDDVLTYAVTAFEIPCAGTRILTIDAPETATVIGAESWVKFDALTPHGKDYDYIFINAGAHKLETQFIIATSLRLLSKQGQIIIAGANDAGGRALAKMLTDFNLSFEEISKQKHRILWVKSINGVAQDKIDAAIVAGGLQKRDDGFFTRAGIFSWDKIDKGTEVFLSTLSGEIFSGVGADFGAGIGVIAHSILSQHAGVTRFDSVEIDVRAADCARQNLTAFDARSRIIHGNATNYKSAEPYDFIVMNPPFHAGKNLAISLGQKFIMNAAANLKKHGSLYLVANTNLPYEIILQDRFKNVDKLTQKNGFKILKAVGIL